MKQKLLILSLALTTSAVSSQAFALNEPPIASNKNIEVLLQEPAITYNKDVIESPGWKGNWFVGINAGANAFIGSPKGCNDLWGRLRPNYGAYIGNWYTPSVGSRVSFSGFQLLNAENLAQDYWSIFHDLMWNFTNFLYGNYDSARIGIIPYIGVGMLHNKQAQTNPFALSYGIIAQYGITSRLKLTMEFGGKTTFSDFDGIVKSNRFGGDNILSLSAGISYTFGHRGFRKVINAKPVMVDNARLREALSEIYDVNSRLSRRVNNDDRIIAELKKILKIEGLLSRYGSIFNSLSGDDNPYTKQFPINNYSGLNSLRARLNGYHLPNRNILINETDNGDSSLDGSGLWDSLFDDADADADSILSDGKCLDLNVASSEDSDTNKSGNVNAYLSSLSTGKKCLGSPILFFLKLGTSDLTDASQLVNLDEIARIAKAYNLNIRVTGAADSATGTSDINHNIGDCRAGYIVEQLKNRGINASHISKINKGGIDAYNPEEANRHCKVELFLTAK